MRRLVIVGLLVASGCASSGPGIADDWGCNLPEPPNPSRCGPRYGAGGFGGDGGEGGEGGAAGFGGEGGAAGVASTTEMVIFYVPDVDCWFWDSACDPGHPPGMALTENIDYTRLSAHWTVLMGVWRFTNAPTTERPPDRVEVCVRKDYVDREVLRVVGACVEPPEYELILSPTGDWEGLTVAVGSFVLAPEVWWYSEVRLYFDPK